MKGWFEKMNNYIIEYGPQIDQVRCAASIHGDCSLLRVGSILGYDNSRSFSLESISMYRSADRSTIEVLINGKIDKSRTDVFLIA